MFLSPTPAQTHLPLHSHLQKHRHSISPRLSNCAPKWKFCHHLLTLLSIQTCMTFLLPQNTKEGILNKVSNRTAAIHFYCVDTKSMKVKRCQSTKFFKISYFVFSTEETCMMSKLRHNFLFWVNFHFKLSYTLHYCLFIIWYTSKAFAFTFIKYY